MSDQDTDELAGERNRWKERAFAVQDTLDCVRKERDDLKRQVDDLLAGHSSLRARLAEAEATSNSQAVAQRALRNDLIKERDETNQLNIQLSKDLGKAAAERDKLRAQLRHLSEPIAERAVKDERDRWKERAFSAEDTVRQLEQKCDDLEAENDLLTVKLAVRREFAANSKDTVRRLEKKLAELEAEIVEYAE